MDTDKIYAQDLVNEYTKNESPKVEELKKLDQKVKVLPTILAYTLGVISSLILGVGMCLSMKVIGQGTTTTFVIGIIIGIIGMVLICINYPLYLHVLAKRKEKYAYEIVTLAKEIIE